MVLPGVTRCCLMPCARAHTRVRLTLMDRVLAHETLSSFTLLRHMCTCVTDSTRVECVEYVELGAGTLGNIGLSRIRQHGGTRVESVELAYGW